jgi:hypothetical protein
VVRLLTVGVNREANKRLPSISQARVFLARKMHERTGELGAQQRLRPAFVQRRQHEALWSPATPGLQLNARPILDEMSGGVIGAAGSPRSLARLEGAGGGRSAEVVRSCPWGEGRSCRPSRVC